MGRGERVDLPPESSRTPNVRGCCWLRHQTINVSNEPPPKYDEWWERESAFKTYEQCIEVKGRVWATLARDSISTDPLVEKLDKVPAQRRPKHDPEALLKLNVAELG